MSERIEKNKEIIKKHGLDINPNIINRSDIRRLEGFKLCAGKINIRMTAYNEELGVMAEYLEGDLNLRDITPEEFGEYLQRKYYKGNVTPYGERLDPRVKKGRN